MLEKAAFGIQALLVAIMLWVASTVQKTEVAVATVVERINQHEARLLSLEADTRFRRGGG